MWYRLEGAGGGRGSRGSAASGSPAAQNFKKNFKAGCCSPSSSNRKWLLKSKEALPTLRDPLPVSILFHELFDTDLSAVTRSTMFSQNTAGIRLLFFQ